MFGYGTYLTVGELIDTLNQMAEKNPALRDKFIESASYDAKLSDGWDENDAYQRNYFTIKACRDGACSKIEVHKDEKIMTTTTSKTDFFEEKPAP